MARKDIEIRVKTSGADKASRNAKKIADELNRLGTGGSSASSGIKKSSDAFAKMAGDVAKVSAEVSTIEKLGTAISKLDKAGADLNRLGDRLSGAAKGFASIRAETQQYAQQSTQLKKNIAAEKAAIAARNDDLKTAKAALNENKKATTALADAQAVLNGKTRKSTSASANVASKGIGIESGAPLSSARDSFAAFLAADMSVLEGADAQIKASVAAIKESIQASKTAIDTLRTELKDVSAREKEFADETMLAGNAMLALREDIAKSKLKFNELEDDVRSANAALGTSIKTQEDVARATARATDELDKQKRALGAMEKYSTGRGTFSDPNSASKLRKQTGIIDQAKSEWLALQAQTEKLAESLKHVSGNATEQVNAFKQSVAATRAAKNEYNAQIQTLGRLQGATKSTFAEWSRQHNPVVASTKRAAQAQKEAAVAAEKEERELAKIAKQAERASRAKRDYASATSKAVQATSAFGHESRTTLSFMQRVRGEVIAITASYIGLFGAYQRIIESAKAYRAVEKAQQNLGVAFGGDTAKVRQEMGYLNAEADRLGYTFETLADGYGKISVSAQGAGFSISDTRKLFTSIIEAARVSGQSVEQTTGILRAFDQILSKGKVQAEELRGQLGDRMTGSFKLFADALGVTTSELDNMMKAGEVLADRGTLIKVAERLTAVYSGELPKALASVGFAMDNFVRTVEKINLLVAEGLVDSLKTASKSLADFVESEDGRQFFRAIGDAAGTLINIIAQLPQHFGLITTVVKALVAIKVAQWAGQFGTSLVGTAKNFGQLGREMTLIGPRMTQLTKSQALFSRAVSAANVQIGSLDRRLRASSQTTVFARARITALRTGLGFLRTGMAVTAAAASAMWTAIGGPIGIATLAISTIYANWETDADRATAALQNHETMLGRVQEAYGLAQGKVEDWGNAVEGVTKLDAEANLLKLQTAYRNALGKIEDDAFALRYQLDRALTDLPGTQLDPQMKSELEVINGLISDLEKGTRPIDEIKQALSDIADTSKFESIVDFIKGLNEKLGETDDAGSSIYTLSKAMEEAKGILKLFTKGSEDAGAAQAGLKSAVDNTNESLSNTGPLEAYIKAIDDLKSKIPSLSDEMERMGKLDALAKARDAGLATARSWQAAAEVMRLYNMGVDEINNPSDKTASFAAKVVQVESGGVTTAKNSRSSATGVGQFIESTWLDLFKRYFPERAATMSDAAILELRKNSADSVAMIDLYAQENASALKAVGAEINDTNLYLAHFLGSAGATSVLSANRTTPVAQLLGADQIAANPSVLGGGKTAGDVIDWANQKMGISAQELAIVGRMNDAEQERLKVAKDQSDATKKRIADLDAEIAKQDLLTAGKKREAEILSAITTARSENPEITDAELAAIREKTGLLYDQQNAQEGIELSEQRVNQLYELRTQLAEQMAMSKAAGDEAGAAALATEIASVDAKLKDAITSAISMWTAIGGVEADTAISKLKTMEMGLVQAQAKVGGFGLSMDTWYSVFQSAIQGIVGAFESFSEAIANGENAFQAFGQSALQVLAQVLQQIAAAIIQMQILRMLSGFSGNIGTFAKTMLGGGMTGHTGGVVGSAAIGAGNRVGPPSWMKSALTYHTGGIAGLAPNEVSATLKKGEEILTQNDPRHRDNLGGGTTADKGGRLTQVLAIGEKQVQEMLNQYGGDAVLTHIKSNAPTIRRMLGV